MGLLTLPSEIRHIILKLLLEANNYGVLHICPCLRPPQSQKAKECGCHVGGYCIRVELLPPPISVVCHQLHDETAPLVPSTIPGIVDFCSLHYLGKFLRNCPWSYRSQIRTLSFVPHLCKHTSPGKSRKVLLQLHDQLHKWQQSKAIERVCSIGYWTVDVDYHSWTKYPKLMPTDISKVNIDIHVADPV